MLGRERACTIFKSLIRLDWVSNPDLPRTEQAFYHWAMGAVSQIIGRNKRLPDFSIRLPIAVVNTTAFCLTQKK